MGSGSSGLKGRGGGSVATAYSDIMDGKATLDSLSALRPQMDIRQATFTTNGNSIKLQVASCSWYIRGRKYKNDGVSVGKTETAFIKWVDLKAKGMIGKHHQTGKYSLIGFEFKK